MSEQATNQDARLNIIAQYLRDISFENPGAPNFRLPEGEKPEMQVNVSVDIRDAAEGRHEVGLKIGANLTHKENKLFIAELEFVGLVHMENIPEDNQRPLLLVEVPRQLFPFARKILHDATREGGWPPLLLDPIDFMQLYRAEQEQGKEQKPESDLPNI